MKMRLVGFLLFIAIIGIVIVAALTWNDSVTEKAINKKEKQLHEPVVLTKEQQKAIKDIEFLYNKIVDTHPATVNGIPKELKIQYEQVLKEIKEKKDQIYRKDIYFWGQSIIAQLHDANSGFAITPSFRKRNIPILYKWYENGVYIYHSNEEDLKVGDAIVAIGDRTVEELAQELIKYIPSDNEMFLLASLEISTLLAEEVYLEKLGLIENKDYVVYTIMRDGKKLRQPVKLQVKPVSVGYPLNYSQNVDKDKNIALLKMNVLKSDDVYDAELKKFFSSVKHNQIDNVVLDLRDHKFAGNPNAIVKLLQYVNVQHYQSFGVTHNSQVANSGGSIEGMAEIMSSTQNNHFHKELVFEGKLYVLTSKNTYGGASLMAAILQDNKIGQVIGETPGGNANAYIASVKFDLPNSKFSMYLSSRQLERPDASKGAALVPDYVVPSTYNKTKHVDEQLAFVEQLVNKK